MHTGTNMLVMLEAAAMAARAQLGESGNMERVIVFSCAIFNLANTALAWADVLSSVVGAKEEDDE